MSKTKCVKLYLVLIILDEIVFYVLSRFLPKKFLYIIQYQMFALHSIASLARNVLKSS